MENLIGFILAILILVGVHEFGHFIVARWMGVRVLRFAIGFGKPLVSFSDSKGTEFCLCAIPLGGYVKMLDSRENDAGQEAGQKAGQEAGQGQLAENDKPFAFDFKPVWQRIAIVIAGPLINILLAIVLFALLNFAQDTAIKPVFGPLSSDSVLYQAGVRADDEVLRVDDKVVDDWQDLHFQLYQKALSSSTVTLRLLSLSGQPKQLNIDLSADMAEVDFDWQAWGLVAWQPRLIPQLNRIEPASAAARANLQPKDIIKAFNGEAIQTWQSLVTLIQNHANQRVELLVEREGVSLLIPVSIDAHPQDPTKGFLGASVLISEQDWLPVTKSIETGVVTSIINGFEQTASVIMLIIQSISQMLTGQVNTDQLGGPIAIAQQAGQSVALGWQAFAGFLALLSISLAILNLLPIPPLDGGQIVLFFAEWIRGKKPSATIEMMLQKIGIAFVLLLTVIALTNDLGRLWS